MRACPFSPFSCSYMMNSPESRITRSVCTCSGMSAVSCASDSTSSIKRCSADAARPVHLVLHQLTRRLPQRQLAIARRLAHHVEGAIADAARRGVDHARSKAASSLRCSCGRPIKLRAVTTAPIRLSAKIEALTAARTFLSHAALKRTDAYRRSTDILELEVPTIIVGEMSLVERPSGAARVS